jgi:hypothetical protein
MSEVIAGNGWLYDRFDTDSQEYLLGRMSKVGDIRKMEDGREFVFVSTAVDIDAGQVVAAPAAVAELAGKFTAAIVGDEKVTVEKSGVAANAYAGGHLIITKSSGTKTTYGIVRNLASDASNKVVLYLDNPIVGAIAATDDCIIVPNKYSTVIVGTATCNPIGVAIRAATAATAGKTQYMWVQTKGVGSVYLGTAASLTVGVMVMPAASGTVQASNGTLKPVGCMLPASAVSNTDCAPIDLML